MCRVILAAVIVVGWADIATAVEDWTTAKTTVPERITVEVLEAEMGRVSEPLILRLRITNPTDRRYRIEEVSVELFDWARFKRPDGLPLTLEAHHHGEGIFVLEHDEQETTTSYLGYDYGLHEGAVSVHYIAMSMGDPREFLEPDPQQFQSDQARFVVSPVGAWWLIGLGALLGVVVVVILIVVRDIRAIKKGKLEVVRNSLPYFAAGVVVVLLVMLLSGSEVLSQILGVSFEAKDFRGGLVIGISFPVVARALIGVGEGKEAGEG